MVPRTVPSPPMMLVPPSTATVMAWSSYPIPASGRALATRDVMTAEARPARSPETVNTQNRTARTSMAAKRAATSLVPTL